MSYGQADVQDRSKPFDMTNGYQLDIQNLRNLRADSLLVFTFRLSTLSLKYIGWEVNG